MLALTKPKIVRYVGLGVAVISELDKIMTKPSNTFRIFHLLSLLYAYTASLARAKSCEQLLHIFLSYLSYFHAEYRQLLNEWANWNLKFTVLRLRLRNKQNFCESSTASNCCIEVKLSHIRLSNQSPNKFRRRYRYRYRYSNIALMVFVDFADRSTAVGSRSEQRLLWSKDECSSISLNSV